MVQILNLKIMNLTSKHSSKLLLNKGSHRHIGCMKVFRNMSYSTFKVQIKVYLTWRWRWRVRSWETIEAVRAGVWQCSASDPNFSKTLSLFAVAVRRKQVQIKWDSQNGICDDNQDWRKLRGNYWKLQRQQPLECKWNIRRHSCGIRGNWEDLT